MSTDENVKEDLKKLAEGFFEYVKKCWEQAPDDVKRAIPATLGVLWKGWETYKISDYWKKFLLSDCPVPSRVNWLFGLGTAAECVQLFVQLDRLQKFTKLIADAKNIQQASKEKIKRATIMLVKVEALLNDFEKEFAIHGANISTEKAWTLSKKKDELNDLLEEVKELLDKLEVDINGKIKVLSLTKSTVSVDSATGVATGCCSGISSALAFDLFNPYLATAGALISVARIGAALYGLHRCKISELVREQLQAELDIIMELSQQNKQFKMQFRLMCKSLTLEPNANGGFTVIMK